MRGEERGQRAMLMSMEVGDRVPREHPLGGVTALAEPERTRVRPHPGVAEGLAADGALYRAQRTDVLRATRLQPVVPLVPRYGCGRAELRPFALLAQPRAAVGP